MSGAAGIAVLRRAWLALLVLSAASTLAALWQPEGAWRLVWGGIVIGFAWFKARVILCDYLGLRAAPTWRRGFTTTLTLLCLLMIGLFAAAEL